MVVVMMTMAGGDGWIDLDGLVRETLPTTKRWSGEARREVDRLWTCTMKIMSLKTVMSHDAATYNLGLLVLVAFFHSVKVSKAPLKWAAVTPRANITSIEQRGRL